MKENDPLHRLNFKRGSELPQAKLTEHDVQLVLELVLHRDDLKNQLRCLTNKSIAEKFGVHQRTIERITSGGGWGHVDAKRRA